MRVGPATSPPTPQASRLPRSYRVAIAASASPGEHSSVNSRTRSDSRASMSRRSSKPRSARPRIRARAASTTLPTSPRTAAFPRPFPPDARARSLRRRAKWRTISAKPPAAARPAAVASTGATSGRGQSMEPPLSRLGC